MNNFDSFGTQAAWPDGTALADDRVIDNGRNYICEVSQGLQNTVLVGLVIAKKEKRSFEDKKNPGTTRSHFHFTLRDSPTDFINVNSWGSDNYINNLARSFKINDIVEVRNAMVQAKRNTESEERWSPWTPSEYQLSINETHSTVSLYSGWDAGDFDVIAHVPIKASNDFYTLSDIIVNGKDLHGEHINIMAAVRSVGKARAIITKTGKQVQRCEVKLFDDTCSSFPLTIWDTEMIDLTQSWIPKDNTDVKVTYDEFRKSMVATCDSKTIITTNPDTREAQQLFKFTQTAEILDDEREGLGDTDFDLNSIHDVFTVKQVKELLAKDGDSSVQQQCMGIIFGFLTHFDLDNDLGSIVVTRCASCSHRVDGVDGLCLNCSEANSANLKVSTNFEILSAFSDHTGTVDCRLKGKIVEDMLECLATDFLSFSQQQATEAKIKYLLERCKVYFKIINSGKRWLRVLSCSVTDPQETASALQKFRIE